MQTILTMAFIVAFVAVAILERRKGLQRIQQDFDAMQFPGAAGLHGRDMRIVKRVAETTGVDMHDLVAGAYWYCVGPGPSYYVAIGQRVQLSWPRSRLEWVIRPLSAERMRGALISDRKALVAAFGEEVSRGQG